MLMAIIEFELHEGVEADFESVAEGLAPHLESIDGFLGADPASSIGHAGRRYEISYWRDPQALATWSDHAEHGVAKRLGHDRFLKWYRIRVGTVERDWDWGPAPTDVR